MKKIMMMLAAAVLLGITGTYDQASAQERRALRRAARIAEADRTAAQVDSILRSESFLFVPNHVTTNLPGLRSVNLTTYYEVAVRPGRLDSHLPYYGRSYSAQMPGQTRSPLNFTALDYTMVQTGTASGKQPATLTLSVRPQNSTRLYTMIFEVYDNATAVLTVREPGSEQVRFTGNLLPLSDEGR